MKLSLAFLGITLISCSAVRSQTTPHQELRDKLETLLNTHHATIGFGLEHLETGDTMYFNAKNKCPMQSTYKLPLAIAVLHQVDMGKLSLNKKVHVKYKDVKIPTWSPIRQKWPNGNVDISIRDLIYYVVAHSDNVACDLLFREMKGTKPVNNYIHSIGISEIQIADTEAAMHNDENAQYRNWCHPVAYIKMFKGLYEKKFLSDSSNAFLMDLMYHTSNSPNRIRAYLPDSIPVAHKTGTSGSNDTGMSPATNDVGLITLPDGTHIALVVLVNYSTESYEADEKIIGLISKTVYEYFSEKLLCHFRYGQTTNASDTMVYRLLSPANENPDKKYPLLVYLHGSGSNGNDNETQVNHLYHSFKDSSIRVHFPCYLLVPQCAEKDVWVSFPDFPQSLRIDDHPTISAALALKTIENIYRQNNIDSSRIYLTGFSAGGEGTLDFISRKPKTFACGVALAGRADTAETGNLLHTPIWLFHGGRDDLNQVEYAEMEYLKLKSEGGNVQLTVFPELAHDCRRAYSNPKLWNWMFEQKNNHIGK